MLTATRPSLATAAQSVGEAQETELSPATPSDANGADHEDGCAIAGWVLRTACPSLSVATHSDVEVQLIDVSPAAPSIMNGADHEPRPPAAGCVLTTAPPAPSTATHSPSDGHEIALSVRPWSISTAPLQLGETAASAGTAIAPATAQANPQTAHSSASAENRFVARQLRMTMV
ncbi:MAG TPA: hypothetical protein VIC06_08920 [Solirubrobacteraceae bacterium]